MEYIDGLEFDYNITKILQLLTRYNKETYYNVMLQLIYKLLEGLKFINDQGIVHNDIKSDNISIRINPYNTELNKETGVRLCVDFLPVYIDLGLSCLHSCQQTVGNVLSSDPELLSTQFKRDHKFDVWSLGITIVGVLINEQNIPTFLGFDMDFHQRQQNKNRDYIKEEYIKHISQLQSVQKLKTTNHILNDLVAKC
jgi:serine/threonine protein kinase